MLADVPGLGKSAQVIQACDRVTAQRVLIVCPAVVRSHLAAEYARWSLWGLPVTILETGTDPLPEPHEPCVVVTSYNLATMDGPIYQELKQQHWDVLWCDEAHNLKTPGVQRTRRLLQRTGLAARSKHTWLSTGTPMPNDARELYVFAKVAGLWEGKLDAWEDAFCEHAVTIFGRKVIGTKNHDALRALIAPVMLRRTVVEGRPSLSVDTLAVKGTTDPFKALDPEVRAEIEAAIARDDWSLDPIPALATVRRLTGEAKAAAAAELVASELTGRDRIICFAEHLSVLDAIQHKLTAHKKLQVLRIDGGTRGAKRESAIAAYQAADTTPTVLLAQIHAAGEGITLTRGSRIIIVEPSWTPKSNEQAIARSWRRTQKEPVHASFLALAGSIDERITAALSRKSRDIALTISV